MDHSDIGKRMKIYESIQKNFLMRRTPVAIRIDGRAFHTFTKNFRRPFDIVFINTMQETMLYLCKNIQNCVFGYTQSDEITLILIDYAKLETSPWFDYNVQKLCSIAASMATMKFNQIFYNKISILEEDFKYKQALTASAKKGAMFDARCFNIPKDEVANLIFWRQLDAIRNSIQMVAQSQFPQKQLQGLSCNKLKEKLLVEKNIDWDDYPTILKVGSACIKNEDGQWFIDKEMPILKIIDDINYRDYIERLI